jgi:hypothetical protein
LRKLVSLCVDLKGQRVLADGQRVVNRRTVCTRLLWKFLVDGVSEIGLVVKWLDHWTSDMTP